MNALRIILSLLLVVATNVAPALAACVYAEPAAMQSACCCEEMPSYDECSISHGACCSTSDNHDKATPSASFRVSVQPVVLPVPAVAFRNADTRGEVKFISLESARRPLHLASNKVYLEKRLLLI